MQAKTFTPSLRLLWRLLATVSVLGSLLLSAPVTATELASSVISAGPTDSGFPAEARVEAVRAATVAAQIAGRVIDVRVEPGQQVKRGDVLMSIDARELAGADAAGQAQLAQAQAAWERSQRLFKQKFISQSALDQAELAYKAAQGNAGATGASLSHARVTAPISGVIGERLIEPGELAAPGRTLVSVFDPAALRVIAYVPQARLAELRGKGAGPKARIELVESGRRIDVQRIEVLPTVDMQSHTLTVRLYLPETEATLLPGMAVRAHFLTGSAEKLAIPAEAVLRRGEVTAVYVLGDDATPRLRQVRLGESLSDGRIEVLAGLSSGERIALEPVKAGIAKKSSR